MEFFDYLKKGVTPYHTVSASSEMLRDAGFTEISFADTFRLKAGGKYFCDIFHTALAAFTIGESVSESSCFHTAAAHTDHPCLHIKPYPEFAPESSNGFMRLNTEMYGGAIYNTWLDKPLSLAGAVTLKSDDPFSPHFILMDFGRPVAVIPNLAIHFNRETNKGTALNPQVDMLPILGMFNSAINDNNYLLKSVADELNVDAHDILDMDLYVYLSEAPVTVGLNRDMLLAPALDNLTSCYAAIKAIIDATPSDTINIALLFDHEEIGSRTKTGADSAVFKTLLEKIWAGLKFPNETLNDAILKSFLFSVDVGHAVHPNHPEKSDSVNKITFGEGVAVKLSSNQRYTLDPIAVATAEMLSEKANVKHKKYMFRADIPGGSTIGPMLSSLVPMHTADIGVPILAMHSSAELMYAADETELVKLLTEFYK